MERAPYAPNYPELYTSTSSLLPDDMTVNCYQYQQESFLFAQEEAPLTSPCSPTSDSNSTTEGLDDYSYSEDMPETCASPDSHWAFVSESVPASGEVLEQALPHSPSHSAEGDMQQTIEFHARPSDYDCQLVPPSAGDRYAFIATAFHHFDRKDTNELILVFKTPSYALEAATRLVLATFTVQHTPKSRVKGEKAISSDFKYLLSETSWASVKNSAQPIQITDELDSRFFAEADQISMLRVGYTHPPNKGHFSHYRFALLAIENQPLADRMCDTARIVAVSDIQGWTKHSSESHVKQAKFLALQVCQPTGDQTRDPQVDTILDTLSVRSNFISKWTDKQDQQLAAALLHKDYAIANGMHMAFDRESVLELTHAARGFLLDL